MSITPANFSYLREIVQKHTGIIIDADKDYLVDSRLCHLLTGDGSSTVDDLVHSLVSRPFSSSHEQVVEAMTNNETWFFRDFQPFEALKKKIIPELVAKNSKERQITIWSAASSFGQEPYSLAMCIREDFLLPGWKFNIVATDIAAHALERARSARYSQMEISRGLPAPLLSKYFRPCGTQWELNEEIRKMVQFAQMNLTTPWPALPPVDVLMLRNVMIYFNIETRKFILRKARNVLRPGGIMFMGAAETTLNIDDSFERVPFGRGAYYQLRI